MGTFSWTFDMPTGTMKSRALSEKLYFSAVENAVFMDHVTPVSGFGKKKGETVTLPRVAALAEPTSAVLDENMRIPEDTFDLSSTYLTVQELGRAVPYNELAEDLGAFDLKSPIQRKLRDQMSLVLDTLAATAFKSTYVKAIPTGSAALTWDTDGTASSAATVNVNLYHIETIRDYMFGTLQTPMMNGRYVGIFHTNGLRGIKRDPDFSEWYKYTSPDMKFNSEVGTLEQIRFVECNHSDSLSGAAGTGSVLGTGVVFGEDSVAMAEAMSPELRAAMPDDYGRIKGVAWYGQLAFGLIWNATATAGEARVVHVTSS